MREFCSNDNHRRSVVTVRFCPNCGDVVNESVGKTLCAPEKHAGMRRVRYAYCMDCGEGLRKTRERR